jgi:glyoxylase-like metal-dependent hydrolase (beta-lactamase superfamily II)
MRLVVFALIALVSGCAQQVVDMPVAPAPEPIAAPVASPTASLPPAPPPALVPAGVTEKLTTHVWAIPDRSASLVPNVGIIVGSQSVLVVDTGMGAPNAETILKEVAKVGAGKPIYIVTTHFHPEHDMGAHAFPAGSKLIRSEDQKKDIAEFGRALADTFAARSALNAELLKDVKHRPADMSFDKEYALDLGGVTAKIYAMGANHTRGDTVVLVDGVLFSGDVAMRPQPSFASPYSSVSHWMKSLDRLDAMKPVHVVPSHGPRGDASIISGYRAYFAKIQAQAAELKKAGQTQDETVQTITDEMAGQYPDRARLGGAVRTAYVEAK